MTYKKLKLEVGKFDLNNSSYIYRKFKNGLDETKCKYPHFAHYKEKKDPLPIIRIKFDFLEDDEIEEQKGLAIAEELRREEKIISYNDWEDVPSIKRWNIIAHHLASECILRLIENSQYPNLITFQNRLQELSFIISFTHLFFKKLADTDIPIDSRYLNFFENGVNKKPFNDFVEECVSITKDYKDYFADANDGYNFLERFLHFIPNCSLIQEECTDCCLYFELMRALNCNNFLDSCKEICRRITQNI